MIDINLIISLLLALILFLTYVLARMSGVIAPRTKEQKNTPRPSYDVREETEQEREARERNELQQKIYAFWRNADLKVEEYVENGELDMLAEFVYNVYETRDKIEHAVQLHFFIIKAIEKAYSHRDENEQNIEIILYLCDLDINNYENLAKSMQNIQRYFLVSPRRKAIILERKKLYNEALSFCLWCYERGYRETKDETFEKRIARLKKKVEAKG